MAAVEIETCWREKCD